MNHLLLGLIAPAAAVLALLDTPMARAQDAVQEGPVATAPTAMEDADMAAPEPTPEVRRAAEVLNETIRQMKAGTPPFDRMAPQLAEAVRAQQANIAPALVAYGEVQDIEYRGPMQGAEHFRVIFAEGQTDWFIALDDQEIIQGLVFRPVD